MSVNKAKNFRSFVAFLKGYLGAMPLVTAALAPLLTLSRALPIYELERTEVASFLALLLFLLLAWVFFSRRVLISAMSRGPVADYAVSLLVLLLITGSVYCFISYNSLLDDSVRGIQHDHHTLRSAILKDTEPTEVSNNPFIVANYMALFVLAELAFLIMAMREYSEGEQNSAVKIPHP
jgi:hypothetical protein